MAVREDILQGVRSWLMLAATLTDDQVIVANDGGPRPELPYLTVLVLVADIQVGEDEVIRGLSGATPTVKVRGTRRATVSVQAFGAAAEEWLVLARLGLRLPTVQADLLSSGLSIEPQGAPRDISRVLDTGIESRFTWDLDVLYGVESDTETETAAGTVAMTTIFEDVSPDPDPLTVTTTISLS